MKKIKKIDNPILKQSFSERIARFWEEHKGIVILMLILFVERLFLLYQLQFTYTLKSDDLSYVKSGITFANTGIISMHSEFPSAQIMPGMTWFIALYVKLFGEGTLLWAALKVTWIVIGVLTAWLIYRIVCMFAPKWCGVVAAVPLLGAEFAWMDNTILTETPFLFFFVGMIYYTLRMAKDQKNASFWGCLICYMGGLMLKANIALYPLFALVYLLIKKYDGKKLIKQIVILSCVVLCFVIPWSIRNEKQFHDFVPLTYGSGNPTLLGTYQGIGYPPDEELDYETNVYKVLEEKYKGYYNEDGNVLPQYVRYVSLQRDQIKANYRIHEWAQRDIKSLIYSYAVLKPWEMITSSFYWAEVFNISWDDVHIAHMVNGVLSLIAIALSFYLKKYRKEILFLLFVYLGNIYIYAMTFAFSRYHATLLPIRYIIVGMGLSLFVEFLAGEIRRVWNSTDNSNTVLDDCNP